MKITTLLSFVFIMLAALVSCNVEADVDSPAAMVDPVTATTTLAEVGINAGEASVSDCPEAVAGAYQLIDAARGVCLLYPAEFDFFEYGEGLGYVLLISEKAKNHEAPVIWITFEPAGGRSLEEVTTQRLADYAFPETKPQAATLGGEPASLLDLLPGQDTNRRIVAIHDDRIIEIVIDHIGKNYGTAGEQAEAAYGLITSSFRFIGIDPGASLIAGP